MDTSNRAFAPMDPLVFNRDGPSSLLITCEHATQYLPASFGDLGLNDQLLNDHVAWDIGAFELAKELARQLDAPLVAAPVSRLIIDPNRSLNAPDLIPHTAEGVPVPGNQNISPSEKSARIAAYHAPYHATIERILGERPNIAGLISIHTFTSELLGVARPWHIGVLFDSDRRLADPILQALRAPGSLNIGENQPYTPKQGVFYAMERHANSRSAVMVEIRNDLTKKKEMWKPLVETIARAATKAQYH